MRGLEHLRRRGSNGTRSRPFMPRTAIAAARCTASCATSAAHGSSSSSRSSSASPRRRGRRGAVVVVARPAAVRAGGRLVTNRSIGGEQYGRFLIDVFEEWVRRDVGEVYVQMFDVALANWVGEPPGLCVHSETCGLALALEHTGDLYSCDHFVEPAYKLGNIKEQPMLELVASQQQRSSGSTSATRCRGSASSATCDSPATGAAPRTGSSARPTASRFQLPLRRLQGLLPPRRPTDAHHDRAAAASRAPSEIAQIYAAEDTSAAATTPAPAAQAASGSAATGPTRSVYDEPAVIPAALMTISERQGASLDTAITDTADDSSCERAWCAHGHQRRVRSRRLETLIECKNRDGCPRTRSWGQVLGTGSRSLGEAQGPSRKGCRGSRSAEVVSVQVSGRGPASKRRIGRRGAGRGRGDRGWRPGDGGLAADAGG